MKKLYNSLSTFFTVVALLLLIGAAGAIDGPTGYENNYWLLCGILAISGILSGTLAIMCQVKYDELVKSKINLYYNIK